MSLTTAQQSVKLSLTRIHYCVNPNENLGVGWDTFDIISTIFVNENSVQVNRNF